MEADFTVESPLRVTAAAVGQAPWPTILLLQTANRRIHARTGIEKFQRQLEIATHIPSLTAMRQYDIAIAYRIYPKVARPARGLPYSEDKLRLAEICLYSLKKSLGNLRAKMWVLLDGCPDSYSDMFRRHFDETDLTLIPLPAVGNQATFGKQIDILLEQNDSEFVYFAEDDYVYLPDQFSLMLNFLRAFDDVDFISPYDHLDCYTREIHRHPKWVRVHAGHHWRTAASTCLTFLTKKHTLRANAGIFRTYCRRNFDCSLWLSLTKKSIYSPASFLQSARREPHFAKVIMKAWIHGWFQILFGRTRKLWVPIPGFATHLDTAALGPSVDWTIAMKQIGDGMNVNGSPAQRLGELLHQLSSTPSGLTDVCD